MINLIADANKKMLLGALFSATLSYIFCQLTLDRSDQHQQIQTLETRIKSLESLLAEKENDLHKARLSAGTQTGQYHLVVSTSNTTKAISANQAEKFSSTPLSDAVLNSSQLLKDLGTQSVNDPRSFSEKANDYLADNPDKAKIAIVSKSIFDMANNRDYLPDYALQAIYNKQSDPDLRRVIAQVLSQRGNNSLIDNQIGEAQLYLSSHDPADRQRALASLAKTHHVSAANSIAPLLQDPDINVKLDALLAIRATGNQTHVHMVEKLLNDPDPAVSSLASDVISNLTNLSEIARTNLSSSDIASELPPIETM
jgi:hypothetical protein